MTDMSGTSMSPVATGEGPSSQYPFETNLMGSFADHPRDGEWASEGRQAACWELPTIEPVTPGGYRHQAPTHSPDWDSTIIVKTGVTRAESGMYNSELPNH